MSLSGSVNRLGGMAPLALLGLLALLAACGSEETAAPPEETPALAQTTAAAVPAIRHPTPAPAASLPQTVTPAEAASATASPTARPTLEPTETQSPRDPPEPPAITAARATPGPTVTPSPTAAPPSKPEPAPGQALEGYSPLLEEAVSGMDFVRDGLSPEERDILDWADSRLFSNPAFLASTWGPDNWPSDVKTASVQAIPLLMLEIDIAKKPDGRHVITWPVDGLDRILDGLGIYEGMCVPCYGKDNYASVDEVRKNQYPIVNDQKHVHREMLKTFAYLALADGEGILMRSLMENDADDFEMLYRRVLPVEQMFTDTSFGWQNQSFMSQITLPDGTVESFPTTVYKIIGDAESEREAAERWFGHINKALIHFTGGTEDFANIYRPYSQTP